MEPARVPRAAQWGFAILAVLRVGSATLGAVYFEDGGYHRLDVQLDETVVVRNGPSNQPTTLELLPGGVTELEVVVLGTSRALLSGGAVGQRIISNDDSEVTINSGTIGYDIWARGTARVRVLGGRIEMRIQTEDESSAVVEDGWIGQVYSYHDSQVVISGGWIDGQVMAYSQVDISGGSVQWVKVDYDGALDISGGQVRGSVGIHDYGRMRMSGGSVGTLVFLEESGTATIHGHDFTIDGEPVGYGTFGTGGLLDRHLMLGGTLASGEPIDTLFWLHDGASLTLVPEPATLTLLALGALLVMRRRRA